jgi:pilus assembly protein Flp/PilA
MRSALAKEKRRKGMLKAQMWILDKLTRPLKNMEGATAVEYGIMVALIAAVIITTVTVVGGKVNNAFQSVNAALK